MTNYIIAKASSKKRSDEPKASAGRYVTGGLFPGFHGAIAGEKGDKRKLKAAGLELGGWFIGSALPGPGSVLGGAVGTHYAHKAGHYKKQNVSKSAFGVEHADISKALPSYLKGIQQTGGAAKTQYGRYKMMSNKSGKKASRLTAYAEKTGKRSAKQASLWHQLDGGHASYKSGRIVGKWL